MRKTAIALGASLLVVGFGLAALASHIPATGTIPENCVEFQAGTTGTQNIGAVSVTLDSWTNDNHTVTFTLAGLTGQTVDISVKYGTSVVEAGPYANGQHQYTVDDQNAISHIRLCVFGEPTSTTTTLTETTTTTFEETTTTVGRTTTTVGDTTTTVGRTTTTDPASTTTVVESTTTAPPTTSGSLSSETNSELPFTGFNSLTAIVPALALLLLGGVLLAANRDES